jgi:hypothetical protein
LSQSLANQQNLIVSSLTNFSHKEQNMPRISPKNERAVVAAVPREISKTEAAKIVKTAGGRDGKISTANELKELKAIRTKYATAFTPAAKKLVDDEIASAAKTVKKSPARERLPPPPPRGGARNDSGIVSRGWSAGGRS